MWLLNFLPANFILGLLGYITHLALLGGAVAYVLGVFARRFIWTENYGFILKLAGSVVFILAVFFEGMIFSDTDWKSQMAEMESKIAVAQAKSDDANKALDEERQKKQQVVVEYRDRVKTEIQVQKQYIDKECTLSDDAIDLYMKSLNGPVESKK